MPASSDAVTPNAYDAEVIVVGAGPVGLTAGCALRHHGVDCLILEMRTEVRAYSRANNLWARPQELLASVGVRDALAAQAYAISTVNFFVNGTLTTPIAIDVVDGPYPQVLYSGQDVIETTLINTFEGGGGQIKRGCEVIDVAQDEAGVTLTPRLVPAGPLFVGGAAPVLSDLDGKAHGAYGLEGQPALVLVRPDGHVAFRGPADRPEALSADCARVFGARTGAAS